MILVLDPNNPRRRAMVAALSGVSVGVRDSAQWGEARDLITRRQVQLLMVAGDLPGFPADMLCRAVWGLVPAEGYPLALVVLAPSEQDHGQAELLLEAGATDVWSQNLPPALLKRRVERLVGTVPPAPRPTTPEGESSTPLSQLGRIAAQISHELKTPASTISNSVDQLPTALTEFLTDLPDVIAAVRDEQEQRMLLRFYVDVIQEVLRGDRPDMKSRRARARAFAEELGHEDETQDLARRLVAGGLDTSGLRDRILEVYHRQGAPPLRLAGSLVEFLGGYRNLKVSSERINRLITAVRSLAKVGAPVSRMDVHQGLQESLDLARLQAPHSVHFVQDLATVPLYVEGQPSQLNQVWTNLLTNAVEALKGRGKICLRTRLLEHGGKRVVCVQIEDDGPGIPPEILNRVFEPFYTTKKEGSGIGLDLCKEIVERHGGSIEVESHPGATRFQVKLPDAAA